MRTTPQPHAMRRLAQHTHRLAITALQLECLQPRPRRLCSRLIGELQDLIAELKRDGVDIREHHDRMTATTDIGRADDPISS